MTTVPTNKAKSIDPIDQFEWEAPPLRGTLSTPMEPEKWHTECPDWCTGEGPRHAYDAAVEGQRRHESRPLRVRLDAGRAYDDPEEDGVRAAHFAVTLQKASRSEGRPVIAMTSHYGDGLGKGEHITRVHTQLYVDEARELVSVLQHLIKVAMG